MLDESSHRGGGIMAEPKTRPTDASVEELVAASVERMRQAYPDQPKA